MSHNSITLTLIVSTILLLSLSSPTLSTSRRALAGPKKPEATGFRATLHRLDSGRNYTRLERLRRAVTRGRHRVAGLSKVVLAGEEGSGEVHAPVRVGNGEFLMRLSIGTPAESYSAIMDTGSDLIWTQCEPCSECFKQDTPVFDPKKSTSFSKMSCSSDLCSALPQSQCRGGCEYAYMYGDYSSTQGVMGTETFTFDKNSVHKIGFGCGLDNLGDGFSQGAGLVGLGRGPLSLVSQLKEPKFSYCLTSITSSTTSTTSSTLLMGSHATTLNASQALTTPLLKNSQHPSFYYLELHGISVGPTRLDIPSSTFSLNPDGSGGVIIDSGTTITYLEQAAFDIVKSEFVSQMKLSVDDDAAEKVGLDLCFGLPEDKGSGGEVEVPRLVFHFEGADLDLPSENYIISDTGLGVACLAMGGSSGMSIFGNVQQQNMLVLHNLEKETLSFLPTQCDQI